MTLIDVIRRHISNVQSEILVTGDFLQYGRRGSVDASLSRLVDNGELRRVANGVFVRAGSNMPTVEEIATAKAGRFGKRIGAHYGDSDSRMKSGGKHGDGDYLFGTDGITSSFNTVYGRVTLVGVGWRKQSLPPTEGGMCCESVVVYEARSFRAEMALNL